MVSIPATHQRIMARHRSCRPSSAEARDQKNPKYRRHLFWNQLRKMACISAVSTAGLFGSSPRASLELSCFPNFRHICIRILICTYLLQGQIIFGRRPAIVDTWTAARAAPRTDRVRFGCR